MDESKSIPFPERKRNITDIPYVCLQHIFSYINNDDYFLPLKLSCKKFKDVIENMRLIPFYSACYVGDINIDCKYPFYIEEIDKWDEQLAEIRMIFPKYCGPIYVTEKNYIYEYEYESDDETLEFPSDVIEYLKQFKLITIEFERVCYDLSDFSIFSDLNLQKLLLPDFDKVKDLSGLIGQNDLRILDLESTEVNDISFLCNLPKLDTLVLYETKVEDISELVLCSSLKSLDLNYVPLTDFSQLMLLTQLKNLRLNSESLDDSIILSFTQLESLDIRVKTEAVTSKLNSILTLTNLTCLKINSYLPDTIPVDISNKFVNMKKLREFNSNCSLPTLDPISSLTNLTKLKIKLTDNIVNLNSLVDLKNLTSVDITGSKNLKDISGLATLPKLNTINFNGALKLKNLTPLILLNNLKNFQISAADELTNLAGLEKVENISTLYCKSLTNHSLTSLESCKIISIHESRKITDISMLKKVEYIYINRTGVPRDFDKSKLPKAKKITIY